MKKELVFLILLLSIVSCTSQTSSIPKSIKEYQDSIDYSCSKDSDCEIKDIRNCCGYFPSCVNKNFRPNLKLVDELCKKEDKLSICGFREIQSCECINNKCGE